MYTNEGLSIKVLLDIICKATKKNLNILADMYLLKDASAISKWKSGKLTPKTEDILKIVEFAVGESSESQRRIMRDKIESVILDAPIKQEIKNTVCKIDDFAAFLIEVLNISTSPLNEKSFEKQDRRTIANPVETVERYNRGVLKNENSRYSGIMEFDMVLLDNNEASIKPAAKQSTSSRLVSERQVGLLQRVLKGKVVLGVLVLAFVSAIITSQMFDNGSKNDTKSNIVAVPKPTAIEATSTPKAISEIASGSATSTPEPSKAESKEEYAKEDKTIHATPNEAPASTPGPQNKKEYNMIITGGNSGNIIQGDGSGISSSNYAAPVAAPTEVPTPTPVPQKDLAPKGKNKYSITVGGGTGGTIVQGDGTSVTMD